MTNEDEVNVNEFELLLKTIIKIKISIFHHSLKIPLYKGVFEVEGDFLSSTYLPPFLVVGMLANGDRHAFHKV